MPLELTVYCITGGGGGGGGGAGEGGGVMGRMPMRLMRCSETRCISSADRPRGHTTTSAIAKSDFSLPRTSPALMISDTSPRPPSAVPTLTPFASFSCDPSLVPHMTSQSSGLALPCHHVFHPS